MTIVFCIWDTVSQVMNVGDDRENERERPGCLAFGTRFSLNLQMLNLLCHTHIHAHTHTLRCSSALLSTDSLALRSTFSFSLPFPLCLSLARTHLCIPPQSWSCSLSLSLFNHLSSISVSNRYINMEGDNYGFREKLNKSLSSAPALKRLATKVKMTERFTYRVLRFLYECHTRMRYMYVWMYVNYDTMNKGTDLLDSDSNVVGGVSERGARGE